MNISRAARVTAVSILATLATGGVALATPLSASAASPTATSASTSASPTAAATPRATTHDIRFGVVAIPDPSSGHSYVDLTFTNISDHNVRIRGYAGISLVAHHHRTQVGRPAKWLTNRGPRTVIVKPGHTVTEIVTIADAADFGSIKHHVVLADGFRVYLPGSRTSAFVPYRVLASTRHVVQLQADPIGVRI